MKDYTIQRSRVLARTAKEAKTYAVRIKIARTTVILLSIAAILTYVVSVLYSKYGSFTVTIDKYDMQKYALSLSEDATFSTQISRLNAKAAENITNISVNDLPLDLDSINGLHSKEGHYFAYTFYLKNVGVDTFNCQYYMYIANVTNDVDKAIRIRLYVDGEPTTYARTRSDGGGAELGTTEFLTNSSVTRQQIKELRPEQVVRFTVVMWVEGDDVDCIDDLIGGTLKTDVVISVLEASENQA